MARSLRPRALAAVFGIYFLIIAYFSWNFANGLTTAWYPADITRWVYTTYMLVAAIFLVGLGGMGLSVRGSFAKQIRDIDMKLGSGARGPSPDALPPPLPDTTTVRDHVDRDIDELLESLSEVEASAVQEAQAMEVPTEASAPSAFVDPASERTLAETRVRLLQRQKLLGRFVAGPAVAAAVALGICGMMLPGADGFAQYNFTLNTAFILGIGYAWIGLGAYVGATVVALVSSKDGRGRP